MGISYEIDLIDAEELTEAQAALFAQLIHTLRDLPTEYAIFDFQNAESGPDEQQGLVFLQMCREGIRIHAEIRIDRPGGRRMYAGKMSEEAVTELLLQMIQTRNAPDLTGWEDITEQAFRQRGDEEFE